MEARWLADPPSTLCTLADTPSESPAPQYLPKRDQVVCWHAAAFGPQAWPLPPVMRTAADASLRHRLFGQALLEGRVLPALAGAWPPPRYSVVAQVTHWVIPKPSVSLFFAFSRFTKNQLLQVALESGNICACLAVIDSVGKLLTRTLHT